MAPFIYINGYPGVGKLTVANELSKSIPKSKVLHSHLLIDPVAAIFERTAEEYQPLRQVLRREVLKSIASAKSTREVTWIFTSSQSSDEIGTSVSKDYEYAAAACNSPFISIILNCTLEENLKRATGEGRGITANNTKLTDLEILRTIRETKDIFHFGDEYELEMDVTGLSPCKAAGIICDHVNKIKKTLSVEG